MIVRERRREIGVLKAIGASNATISWQFIVRGAHPHRHGGRRRARRRHRAVQPGPRRAGVEQLGRGGRTVRPFSAGPGGGPGGAGRWARSASAAASPGASPSSATCSTNIQASVGFDVLLYGLLIAVAHRRRRQRVPVVPDRPDPPRRSHEERVVMLTVTDLSKTFESGDTGCRPSTRREPHRAHRLLRRRHRAQRQRQEHVALAARRARQADERADRGRRGGHHRRQRPGADPLPPPHDRLRVPELQPGAEPHRASRT